MSRASAAMLSAPVHRLGFIGVGTIAAAVLQGLRVAFPGLPMHLSPRSERTSRAIADADPLVTREASNAAVVAASDIVLLTMLPTQLDAVVGALRFRPDQIVVSCVAGATLAEVSALVAPARCCRLVPLPMIARREGPILLYPMLPEVHRLFAGLGAVIVPGDERAFAAYVTGGAVMSSFFALEAAVARWITEGGADPASASTYVRALFRALAETGMRADPAEVGRLVAGHETPGGLNQRIRRHLEAQGWFAAPGAAFAAIGALDRTELVEDGPT